MFTISLTKDELDDCMTAIRKLREDLGNNGQGDTAFDIRLKQLYQKLDGEIDRFKGTYGRTPEM